jgi:hypothetical protein
MYQAKNRGSENEHKKAERSRFVDVARGERAEVELDAFIERRSRKDPDADEREELWRASVRRYNARRREENRRAWCAYFSRLAGVLRARAEEYDRRAALLTNAEERTS